MSGERNGIEREDILNDILEERREFEGRLEHQLNRLEQLIGALVNISRMETGMIRLQPETGRIFDTILEAVNGIWVKAQKKNIEIQMDAGDDIEDLMISHDRKWLCEALLNLLEFIISGIVEQSLEELENQSYTAYVSQACYESLYRPEERAYSIYFTLSDAVSVNSSTLEMTIKDLAESCGINPEYAVVNGYYSMWVMDPGAEMIAGCIVVALIVVFFAVLVIYNIFQVGLVQKIQEYGKIRALGATKK